MRASRLFIQSRYAAPLGSDRLDVVIIVPRYCQKFTAVFLSAAYAERGERAAGETDDSI
jgi:hypothetical protein